MATEADEMKASMTVVSKDSVTDAGKPIIYLNTPNPEISSSIMTIPTGTTTEWMTHPVQGYVYVLEGTLIVEFADGHRREFKAGQGFPQARSKWHRGRNDGDTPVRFLAVFFGGRGCAKRPESSEDPRNTLTAAARAGRARQRPLATEPVIGD